MESNLAAVPSLASGEAVGGKLLNPTLPTEAIYPRRTRTISQDSTRTIKCAIEDKERPRERAISPSVTPLARSPVLGSAGACSIKPMVTCDALVADSDHEQSEPFLTCIKSNGSPITKEHSALKSSACPPHTSLKSVVTKSGIPRPTSSSHGLSAQKEDSEDDSSEISISVVEVEEASPFDEWCCARDAERLSDEDQAIIRKVVASIVDNESVCSEHNDDQCSCHVVPDVDELEDIPGFDYDGTEAIAASGYAALSPSEGSAEALTDRFVVDFKRFRKHTALWDAPLDEFFAWQGTLCVTDRMAVDDEVPRIPIQHIEIEWRTIDATYNSDGADHGTRPYKTSYEGQTLRDSDIAKMNPDRGIYTEPYWSYILPGFLHGGGAWALPFWVPVPMTLFENCECRKFRLRSRVFFEQQRVQPEHSCMVDVTIENLHSERLMGRGVGVRSR